MTMTSVAVIVQKLVCWAMRNASRKAAQILIVAAALLATPMRGHAELGSPVVRAGGFAMFVAAPNDEAQRPPAAAGTSKTTVKGTTKASSKKDAAPNDLAKSIADQMKGSQSTPWAIVFGLTLLTLLPAILLSMTPMVRLLVVFHFLRQALGTQTAPSNQVLMGLALMMTWFLMQPVLVEVEQKAVTPYREGAITGENAIEVGIVPVKQYMLRYAREKDLMVFAAAGMSVRPQTKMDLPLQVIFPAYMLSELKAGFQIGAVLFSSVPAG